MCEINISKYYFGIIDMKTIKSKEMDMLNGGLVGKLILFSLPLAFSSILQQLFNSADVAVVGRFAGDNALAAVGSCVALVGIFVNLIVGLAVGPNAVLANLIGQKQRDKINDMVHTILTFGTILGLGLMILGFASARIILELSGTPSGVLAEALLYIRIYFLSIPFMTVYNFGAAILRSFGDTRRPMFYLIISGIVNVILNLILVICFHLGVAGVAISTVISNIISAVMVMVYLYRRDDEFAFRFNRMKIVRPYLRKILQIGIPSGIQGTIFSISNVFIQSGINSFGKFAIAGSSLALNFEYFTYDIANAFAQATVTFTSQNYGAGKKKRMDRVLVDCMILSVIVAVTLGGGANLFGPQLLHIYTTEADVIACGTEILLYTTLTYFLCGIMDLIPGALRGMGHSAVPMILSIIGTVGTRIFWIYWVFPMHRSLMVLFLSYPASWTVTILLQAVCFYFVRKKVHSTMPQEET